MILTNIVLFILILYSLGLLRHQISLLFQGISLLVFNSYTPGVILYSIFFLPGVIIHEMSHMLTAEILGVRTGRINIFPTEIKPGHIKMGSVESVKADPFREILIGIAPLVVSIILIFLLSFYLYSGIPMVLLILILYLIFTFANTMFSSKEDMRSFWFIPLPVIAIIGIIYIFKISVDIAKISGLFDNYLILLNKALGLCLILDIFFLITVNILKVIIEKVTGKVLLRKTTN